MIITAPSATSIARATRLDASYFTAPGVITNIRLDRLVAEGSKTFKISDVGTVEHVTRFKRVLAAPKEPSVPFLRAFDVFEYLPEASDSLSLDRTPDLDALRVEPGVILITRSGRNLGPCVLTDDYLAGFIPSDDLLRVRIENESNRLFAFAFLSSPSGQDLLRQDRTGSVISHLSAGQVGNQKVPVLASVFDRVVELVGQAHQLRAAARKVLDAAVTSVDAIYEYPVTKPLSGGWTVRASTLASRLDTAFHHPSIRRHAGSIAANGGPKLGDVADVTKPGGRYKTNYVTEEHGNPVLSGRQLLQFLPIGLKYLAKSVLANPAAYELKTGTIAFPADGRAEESLGQPVLITDQRDGWLASGHVGRARPYDARDAGWIWASLASQAVRRQVAAMACGSVVDALYEEDVKSVVLPPRSSVDSAAVINAWNDFDRANGFMDKAIEQIETVFRQ
ncbi:hypothetical protein [Frigoribacterium sp. 2355]